MTTVLRCGMLRDKVFVVSMDSGRTRFFEFLNELGEEFFALVHKHGGFLADCAQASEVVSLVDDAQGLCFIDARNESSAFSLIFIANDRAQFLEELERSARLVSELARYFAVEEIDAQRRAGPTSCPITPAERFFFNFFGVRLFRVLGEGGLKFANDVKRACVACVGSVCEGGVSLYFTSTRHDDAWPRFSQILGELPDLVLVPIQQQ